MAFSPGAASWSEWGKWTYRVEHFCYGRGVTGRYRSRICYGLSCIGESQETYSLEIAMGQEASLMTSLQHEQGCSQMGMTSFTGLHYFCSHSITSGGTLFWTGMRVSETHLNGPGPIILYKNDGTADKFDSTYIEVTNSTWLGTSVTLANYQLGKECICTSPGGVIYLVYCDSQISQTTVVCDNYKLNWEPQKLY